MITAQLLCPKCQTPLPAISEPGRERHECIACGVISEIETFPAFFQQAAVGQAGERILIEGEAGCFYHSDKKATVHCSGCGRFLCALCDVELNGQHLCLGCLESNQRKGQLAELETRRTVYDSAALSLALWPILIWPFTLVTAPIAAFLAVLSWFRPNSLVRGGRLRSIVALVIATAQIAGWVVLFGSLFLKQQ